MKTKSKLKIILSFAFTILIISSIILLNETNASNKTSFNNRSIEGLQMSRTTSHSNILWIENPTFQEPVDPWFSSIEGDNSDAITSASSNQANIKVRGESFQEDVLLDNTTYSNWEAFNKTELVVVPQRSSVPSYGIDSDGAWCSHLWNEGETGGQPKNTPIMHWRTNVSLGVDMSDYIITSVDFSAIINASVNANIDSPGDTYAKWTPTAIINQYETYDYARFYVEITTLEVDELNTYRIAFNQTLWLGNEGLLLYDIEGLIGVYDEQAIIDALTNVLAVDPGHNNFSIVIGIYLYCEDNNSGTDLDDWTELRFKSLNLTFSYVKKINQFTTASWKQDLDAINGSNVRITGANLNFKYKIDQNWTQSSQNSQIRMYINDRKHEQSVSLIDYIYSPSFQEAQINGYDITSKILPYEEFILSIQVYFAEDFGLPNNITISITDVYLYISYTQTFPDIFSEPWVSTALLIVVSVAAVCLGGYFVAYQRVLKYPRPVRKVRKYKRTLGKVAEPDVPIIPRDIAFKKTYNRELGETSRDFRLKAGESKISQVMGKLKIKKSTSEASKPILESEELISKSLEKKEELDKLVDKS